MRKWVRPRRSNDRPLQPQQCSCAIHAGITASTADPELHTCCRLIHAPGTIQRTRRGIYMCVFVSKHVCGCAFAFEPGPVWPGLATESLQGCRLDKKGAEVERGEGLQ